MGLNPHLSYKNKDLLVLLFYINGIDIRNTIFPKNGTLSMVNRLIQGEPQVGLPSYF